MPRLLTAAVLALILALAPVAATRAEVPPAGPRLAVNVEHVYPNSGTEVRTMGPAGEAQASIAGGADSAGPGPVVDTAPSWSPDGRELAFLGPAGEAGPLFYLVGEDGRHFRRLKSSLGPAGPLTFVEEPPIFDPHGDLVGSVFKLLRGHFERSAGRFDEKGPPVVAAALWAFPTDGSKPRPLAPFKRSPIILPRSFAPDGTLLAELATKHGLNVGTLDPHGGPIHTVIRWTAGVEEPVFSPDGSQIAYVRENLDLEADPEEPKIVSGDLIVTSATGGTPRLVAEVKGGARWPAWDPSGSRLSFTKLEGSSSSDLYGPRAGNSVMEVNADGTCLTKVFATKRGTVFGSAWQPGADRGTGPISC